MLTHDCWAPAARPALPCALRTRGRRARVRHQGPEDVPADQTGVGREEARGPRQKVARGRKEAAALQGSRLGSLGRGAGGEELAPSLRREARPRKRGGARGLGGTPGDRTPERPHPLPSPAVTPEESKSVSVRVSHTQVRRGGRGPRWGCGLSAVRGATPPCLQAGAQGQQPPQEPARCAVRRRGHTVPSHSRHTGLPQGRSRRPLLWKPDVSLFSEKGGSGTAAVFFVGHRGFRDPFAVGPGQRCRGASPAGPGTRIRPPHPCELQASCHSTAQGSKCPRGHPTASTTRLLLPCPVSLPRFPLECAFA